MQFNTVGATIYLDSKNCSILEKELNDVEGLTLDKIQNSKNSHTVKKLTILKVKIPAITIKKIVRKIELDKELPKLEYNKIFENIKQETSGVNIKYLFNTKKSTLQLSFESSTEFGNDYEFVSNYQASYELSNNYNIDYVRISKLFNQKFVNGLVPISSYKSILTNLSKQSVLSYKIVEEVVEQSLMLIKPEEFLQDENGDYYIEIQVSQDNLLKLKEKPENEKFGYHYSPYNFDSTPEISFFEVILDQINQKPENIEDFYFTGGLTNPNQTDFYFEYKKENGDYSKYYPDFVIVLKTGKIIIVEIKSAKEKDNLIDGQNGLKSKSIQSIIGLNPDKIQYEYVSLESKNIPTDKIEIFKNLIQN